MLVANYRRSEETGGLVQNDTGGSSDSFASVFSALPIIGPAIDVLNTADTVIPRFVPFIPQTNRTDFTPHVVENFPMLNAGRTAEDPPVMTSVPPLASVLNAAAPTHLSGTLADFWTRYKLWILALLALLLVYILTDSKRGKHDD